MTVEQLINNVVNLQPDNPDKVGTFFSLYGEMPRNTYSKNNLFLSSSHFFQPITSLSLIDENNLRSNLPLNSSINLQYAFSLESSILSSSSVTFYTNNVLPSGIDITNKSSILTNLYEQMKLEAGALKDYISLQNDYIVLPFDKIKVNELISCSLGNTTDETILSQGRLQFAKEAAKILNEYIEQNNLFYYYIPKDIELNYSDDDGYDSTYAQLKTENVYNYFDENYETQSRLVDEKLLPGALHQVKLYKAVRDTTINTVFEPIKSSTHFATKQLFGENISFSENIYTTPNISYIFLPNERNAFDTSLYSNWQASNYISGSYTHYNGYQPINSTRTEQNNTNLFIDITTETNTSLYIEPILSSLEPKIPYYSKVSFGIPQQETNFVVSGTLADSKDDITTKTIFSSLVNNLYVDGQVIDEDKLILDSSYTTSSVNINLLKFFDENYNTQETTTDGCSDTINSNYEKLKIGKDTNTIDNIFAFLSYYGAPTDRILNAPIAKDEQQEYMAEFTNIEADSSGGTNFGDHLLQNNKTYEKFLCSRANTENKYYFLTKIAKYRVEQDGSESFVQNFYFDLRKTTLGFPTDDLIYEFFDNQIYSGERYNYKISQLIIVPAFSYGYTGVDVIEKDGDLSLLLGVSGVPIYKLIEVPVTSASDIVVMEKPPTTPRVQFYPILNNKNEIIIQISPFGFEKTEEPIIIEDSDTSIFDKALESQNSTGSLLFTKDYDESGVESYEIYRTTTYPNSYSYFSSFKHATISNISDTVNNYYDRVQPNTPYYYCVRSKNFRGLPSNPTKVYKITLVEDGEFYTLQQEIIEDINSENIYNRKAVKDIKRFLYISPSETQKLISGSIEGNATDAITDFPLSSASEEVWGKRFKIRITSKSSGKSVDFNIKFNKNNSGEFVPE